MGIKNQVTPRSVLTLTMLDGRTMRVLVVDDIPVASAIIRKRLQKLPIPVAVDQAADGAAAFAMCQCCVYDTIIMDLEMPRCDGRTAMVLIRKRGLNMATPILVNSARCDLDYLQLRALGATCILEHKCKVGIDESAVRQCLEGKKLHSSHRLGSEHSHARNAIPSPSQL